METCAVSLATKKAEIQAIIKEKGKDSMQLKLVNEEVDEVNQQMRELKTQLDNSLTKMISLQKRRDQFQSEWRQAGHKDLAIELLSHILKENIILVENLDF
jgi:predicted RNase H-like nuclease (RuvC/YqgF family)